MNLLIFLHHPECSYSTYLPLPLRRLSEPPDPATANQKLHFLRDATSNDRARVLRHKLHEESLGWTRSSKITLHLMLSDPGLLCVSVMKDKPYLAHRSRSRMVKRSLLTEVLFSTQGFQAGGCRSLKNNRAPAKRSIWSGAIFPDCVPGSLKPPYLTYNKKIVCIP